MSIIGMDPALIRAQRAEAKPLSPGPWRLSEHGLDDANGRTVLGVCSGTVYSEYTSDPPTIEWDNEANRRAIEAAPQMVALLRQIAEGQAGADAVTEWLRAHDLGQPE